jgi:hypothetical protein
VEVAYNQSEFDYRREEGVNQSSLKKILESPAHYQAALKNKLIPTPAMEMGTALHCLTLDGREAFDRQYVLKPADIKLTTKEGKEWKAAQGRKKILNTGGKDDAWNSVLGMDESLRRLAYFDPSQPDYIKYNEVSVYWEWEGVPCKARLDRVDIENNLVLDLKTTDSVEPELFTKKVVGLGYDFQAAAYSIAAEAAFGKPFKFIFACVERKAPYTVSLFEVSDEMMEEGKRKFDRAIRIYNECQASGEWPNKPAMINKLTYPSWYHPHGRVEESPEDIF